MNLLYSWGDLFKLTSVKLWSVAITLGGIALARPAVEGTIHFLMPWLAVPEPFWTVCGICAIATGAAGIGARNVKQDNAPLPKPPGGTP